MIAQRMENSSDLQPVGEGKLAIALRQFAAPPLQVYGQWHSFASEADALRAVITEIGETVLARRVRVSGQETDVSIVLTITNRHLAQIEGADVSENEELAAAVIVGMAQALAGCRTLKFDVIERNPDLPKSSRSWSFDALVETVELAQPQSPSDGSCFDTLIDAIKALAVAWRHAGPDQSEADCAGEAGDLGILAQSAVHSSKTNHDQARLRTQGPTLSVLSGGQNHILVLLESREEQLYGLCETNKKAEITAAWRAYLK